MTDFINYTDFEPERLLPFDVQEKQSSPKVDPNNPTAPPKSETYFIINFQYRYSKVNDKGIKYDKVNKFYVRYPKIRTTQGISYRNPTTKENLTRSEWIKISSTDTKTTVTIPVRFDMSDNEQRLLIGDNEDDDKDDKVVGFQQKFLKTVIERLFEVRGKIKPFATCKNLDSIEGKIYGSGPIHYQTDSTTNQIIPGSAPSKFFPLLSYGKIGSHSRKETKFTYPVRDPDTNDFLREKWDLLSDVNMDFIPLVNLQGLTIALGQIFFRDVIDEAVICDISPADSGTKQSDLLEQQEKDNSVVQKITDQMNALKKAHASAPSISLPSSPPKTKPQEEKPQEVKQPEEKPQEVKQPEEKPKDEKPQSDDDDDDELRAKALEKQRKKEKRALEKARAEALEKEQADEN